MLSETAGDAVPDTLPHDDADALCDPDSERLGVGDDESLAERHDELLWLGDRLGEGDAVPEPLTELL